jgi:hypothetical protein
MMSIENLNLESVLMRAAAYMAASKKGGEKEEEEYEDIIETEEITPEKL